MIIIRRILQFCILIAILVAIGLRVWQGKDLKNGEKKRIDISQSAVFQNKTSKAKVVRVYDGDTVELEGGEIVRYLGIDTPEVAHPPKRAECYGNEAKKTNETMVLGKTIVLVADQTNVDRYDRLLRHVFVEGVHVNQYLAQSGVAFALVYPPDTMHSLQISESEQFAREKKLGIWGKCNLSKRGRQ